MSEVGRKCGRTPKSVTRWAEGVDPKDRDARLVLSLYARHCPEKYQEHARQFEVIPPDVSTRIGRVLQILSEPA